MKRTLACGRYRLPLDRPLIMGVINVTPDSFFDGGRHATSSAAIEHALRLASDGADILDIGGESTRPGAEPIALEVELARLVPVIEALRDCGKPLSIDTRTPEVMRRVLALGADMINDVNGFRSADAIAAVSASQAAVCVMHMQGEPSTMQKTPVYRDVVSEVCEFLYGQTGKLSAAGVAPDRIVLDPGIGFGKTQPQNVELIEQLGRVTEIGQPVMVGVSRKSLIGYLTGQPAADRLAGSVAGALAAVFRGAAIVRVHDVAETRDALRVWGALSGSSKTSSQK
jgi:dihydropteroate synthase